MTVPLAAAIPAVIVILAIGIMIGRVWLPSRPWSAGAPAVAEGARAVEFVVTVPHAARVSVVGDWNGWDPRATPMTRNTAGAWRARVSLPPGRHTYAYVVDGERWETDPLAPLAPANAFGFRNSVILVGESQPS